MKITVLLASLIAFAATPLIAGPGGGAGKAPAYGKGPVAPPTSPGPAPVSSCEDCFGPGTEYSIFVAGIAPDGDALDDGIGAGLAINHWYSRYLGTELSVAWLDNHSVIHSVRGSVVGRYPIAGSCLAPYVLAGVGYHANSYEQETYHYGGGLDYRLNDCTGIFADYTYTTADDSGDYSLIRGGIRRRF